MARRFLQFLLLLATAGAVMAWARWAQAQDQQAPPAAPFGFGSVVERARDLASRPYDPVKTRVPAAIADLDYDAYRSIRFKPDHALWHGERRFEVQFFHPGFLFNTPIRVNVVKNSQVFTVLLDKGSFDYGDNRLSEAVTEDLGFAGFRIHYPLNAPGYKDEVIVFQGASYFRVVGRSQHYGLSARGLAIDTGLPSGEEFPLFREFWLVTPEPEATSMTVYALLDSVRVAGAYQFVINPATDTEVHVTARLFVRSAIEKLGIAPLTSMHLFGENALRSFDNHRPEVHDSDGLLMHSGAGQWLWRPIVNGRDLGMSAFIDNNPRGFGLMQRDRDFAHYRDLEARFHQRPSTWITPDGEWGEGAVELVEIPANEEIHDNVVAFWTPRAATTAGQELSYTYTLTSSLREPFEHRLGRVVATRIGAAFVPGSGEKRSPERRLFVVEFDDGDLPFLDPAQDVVLDLSNSAGKVFDLASVYVPETKTWRAQFRLDTQGSATVELALRLVVDGDPVTETWMYRYSP